MGGNPCKSFSRTNNKWNFESAEYAYQVDSSNFNKVPLPVNQHFRQTCRVPYYMETEGHQYIAKITFSLNCRVEKKSNLPPPFPSRKIIRWKQGQIYEKTRESPPHTHSHQQSQQANTHHQLQARHYVVTNWIRREMQSNWDQARTSPRWPANVPRLSRDIEKQWDQPGPQQQHPPKLLWVSATKNTLG
jgi:hypothetical protein